MGKSRSIIKGLLFVAIMLSVYDVLVTLESEVVSSPDVAAPVSVLLSAESGSTIPFKTQNGRTVDQILPRESDLPYLVLRRNGVLTEPNERTLMVTVNGIEVPPPGVTVTLEMETEHGDPDLGGGSQYRIPVWRESLWISNTLSYTQTGISTVFRHEFNDTMISGTQTIATPTDYFRYQISLTNTDHPNSKPWQLFSESYAILMENQWITPLPDVRQESSNAAPDELILYYCDMFLFQKSIPDATTRLPRQHVSNYVSNELVPQMIEAFRIQSRDWGFIWYHEWTSSRAGTDAERLSVALTNVQTWFHGKAPSGADSQISINVKGGNNAKYDTLADGIISSFHHELFHNAQRNISLERGGNGDLDGKESVWAFFSEGTAVLAASVGMPQVQFAKSSKARAYMEDANLFIASGVEGDLNTSYEEMFPYHGTIYWRFLYEQCGGLKDGVENPAAGMQIIIRTLNVLYSKEVVDISSSSDLVEKMPEIMDRSLGDSSCPFRTHAESLIAFARDIYALRLDSSRCIVPGGPSAGGLWYDPNRLYQDPPVSTIIYNGSEQLYSGELGSSFGMDFVEVILETTAVERPLALEVFGEQADDWAFNVQLWKLTTPDENEDLQRIQTQMTTTEILASRNADGHLSYVVPAIATDEYNCLGLIITRLDAKEDTHPIGEYTITLRPDVDIHD